MAVTSAQSEMLDALVEAIATRRLLVDELFSEADFPAFPSRTAIALLVGLTRAGIITRRPLGRFVYWSLTEDQARALGLGELC